MARTREFDVDDTLAKAVQLFWRKGYEETSVRELVKFTGVAHAGLYSAFGGKRGLFTAALRKYIDENITEMFAGLEHPESGRAAIEAILRGLVGSIRFGGPGWGCFVVNTAVKFSGERGEVGDLVRQTFERQVAAFRAALDRARDRGEVRDNLDTEQISNSFAVTFYGLSSLARADAPEASLEHAAEAAISLMDN